MVRSIGSSSPSVRGTSHRRGWSSFAYRAKLRPVDANETARELGAYTHGPNAAEAAERFAEQIRIWDRDYRHGPGPRLTVHPADTPDASLPTGLVIDRRHTRIVISWPGHPA